MESLDLFTRKSSTKTGFEKGLLDIGIVRSNKRWTGLKCCSKKAIRSVVYKVLGKFPNFKSCEVIEVAILLTDNSHMQLLNNEFRGKNKPTNVLSFPDRELDYKTILEFSPPKDYISLGDIAFGYEIIKEESDEQNKSLDSHFTHLLIHSLLHLLGFDHENDEDTKVMQALEVEVLKELSIPSPY